MILGIDAGISATKIIGLSQQGVRIGCLRAEASDQTTSIYGALGKFMGTHNLRIGDIERIAITGVGAFYVGSDMYGIPARQVDEFLSIGTGGLAVAELESAVIISAGMGTALVHAGNNKITHLGGSGLGGGTLLKMAMRLTGATDFPTLIALANLGDIRAVNLQISDISSGSIGKLSPATTVSNFGKLQPNATSADMALGLINMIFESIGTMAALAAQGCGARDIVLTGALSEIKQGAEVFHALETLYPVRFHIPPQAMFATAWGAALATD
ncbi:MAG: pantothenate kinase [Defluviitaleaceae bacterium]|nr:pantothenate kinase [Defluviitaleaceae bacterium]MCL2238905.1 pantothenate kinase [Defluviitaleaceae bacterium]MCL2239419.1 pantothenate kinase [Defluviitaleaceae bacterium]